MTHVSVIFNRKHTIGSLFLRGYLWSKWSHCAIIDGDQVIEAATKNGVVTRPLSDLLSESSAYEIVDFECSNPQAVIEAARTQIGRPYDYFGILGIGFRRRWQDVDSWFCSELIAWAFDKAGFPMFSEDAFRITPRDLAIARRG